MKPQRTLIKNIDNTYLLNKKALWYGRNNIHNCSYEEKLETTKRAIKEYFEFFGGRVFLQYGGGIKSDVLRDIINKQYAHIYSVYLDNGTDFDVIRNHALETADIVYNPFKIKGSKRPSCMKEVIEKYGYPTVSNLTDMEVWRKRRERDNPNCDADKELKKEFESIREELFDVEEEMRIINDIFPFREELLDADFDIAPFCCRILFQGLLNRYMGASKCARISPIITTDSKSLFRKWVEHGENDYADYEGRKRIMTAMRKPVSYPLARWTRSDILRYAKENNIDYCKEFYGDIIEIPMDDGENQYITSKRKESKCKYCIYKKYENEPSPNRWEQMKKDFPKEYKKIIEGGEYRRGKDGVTKWKPNSKGLGFSHIMDFLANICHNDKFRKY